MAEDEVKDDPDEREGEQDDEPGDLEFGVAMSVKEVEDGEGVQDEDEDAQDREEKGLLAKPLGDDPEGDDREDFEDQQESDDDPSVEALDRPGPLLLRHMG